MLPNIPAILAVVSAAAFCFAAPVTDGSGLVAREDSPGRQ